MRLTELKGGNCKSDDLNIFFPKQDYVIVYIRNGSTGPVLL